MQSDDLLAGTFVWALAPALQATNDATLDYYYDFSQSIDELTAVFAALDLPWKWQPVAMHDLEQVIGAIRGATPAGLRPVVLNLCDGDEVNGAPGVSVIHCLERHGLIYTGSDAFFYEVTTSKISMKRAFDAQGVPCAPWEPVLRADWDPRGAFARLGTPLIVKPAVSAGSMGIGIRNVVADEDTLRAQVVRMFEGYRGWQLSAGGVVVESFIPGPEYTVLVVGSYLSRDTATLFRPVERIFHRSLPENERFLSFDRLWSLNEEEPAMPDGGHFYEYASPDPSHIDEILRLSWDAYVATRGQGYARIDLRMDARTQRLFVLEVNAQCGLSDDENYTSIGAILRLDGATFVALIRRVLEDAVRRAG